MTSSINRHTSSFDSGLLGTRVNSIALQAVGCRLSVTVSLALDVGLWLDTQISSVDICLLAFSGTELRFDELLVGLEDGLEFLEGYVVEEDAFAEFSVGDGESLLAVSGLSANS
jgi:hypothetical protein